MALAVVGVVAQDEASKTPRVEPGLRVGAKQAKVAFDCRSAAAEETAQAVVAEVNPSRATLEVVLLSV